MTVEERLLGSNSTGYITLRTEVDNLGTYYGYRTKRFLVEYSKQQSDPKYQEALGAEIDSQLMLDVSTSFDASHPKPFSTEATSHKVNAKNNDVKLADLLERFPNTSPELGGLKKFAKLTWDSTNGLRLGRIRLAWGGWIKKRFVGDQNANLEWVLNEVFEDENCLYLSVFRRKARAETGFHSSPKNNASARSASQAALFT